VRRTPGTLTVLALLLVTVIFIQQEGSETQVPPVFVSSSVQPIYVELCGPLLSQQDSCVIAATSMESLKSKIIQSIEMQELRSLMSCWLAAHQLSSGNRLSIGKSAAHNLQIECAFMAAAKRITLDIPLHPDHMTQLDWQALPGVGEKLAATITADRSSYGDFGSISALTRVRGISDKKLLKLRPYF